MLKILLILTKINICILILTIYYFKKSKNNKKKSNITPKLSDLHGKDLSNYLDKMIDD